MKKLKLHPHNNEEMKKRKATKYLAGSKPSSKILNHA